MCDAVRVGSDMESDVTCPELVGRQPVLVPVLFVDKAELPKFSRSGPWVFVERILDNKNRQANRKSILFLVLAPRRSMTSDCFIQCRVHACKRCRVTYFFCLLLQHICHWQSRLSCGAVLQEMEQCHSGRPYTTGCSYSHMCIG